jgi:hypothetical protein
MGVEDKAPFGRHLFVLEWHGHSRLAVCARVGVLMRYRDADLEATARIAQCKQELAKLGWIEGGNVLIEEWWVDLANA